MTQVVPRLNKILQCIIESSTINTSPVVMTIVCCSPVPHVSLPALSSEYKAGRPRLGIRKGDRHFSNCWQCQEPFRGAWRGASVLYWGLVGATDRDEGSTRLVLSPRQELR